MTDKAPRFTETNRYGEVFEGRTQAEARAKRIAAARRQLVEDAKANPDAVAALNTRLARLDAARKRERQRVEHLVLGKPRPVERVRIHKGAKRKRPKLVERPVALEPGIEEAMRIREVWSHRWNGTPETLAQAGTHSDALIQMHRNGTLDKDQLEWAAQIANVYRSLEADVAVKVASLEARVDQSRRGGQAAESVYRVRMHLAYGYWRAMLPAPKQMVLDMIVGDAVGYTVAARRYRVHNRKAKRCLIDALNRWPRCVGHAFSAVDEQTIQALQWGEPVPPGWLAGPSAVIPRENTPVDIQGPAELPPLPPIDPDFVDENGMMLHWDEVAAVIRARAFSG